MITKGIVTQAKVQFNEMRGLGPDTPEAMMEFNELASIEDDAVVALFSREQLIDILKGGGSEQKRYSTLVTGFHIGILAARLEKKREETADAE